MKKKAMFEARTAALKIAPVPTLLLMTPIAVGSVTAAPAPGMCWYYTDMTHTQGFWDYCP
ncbi:hypothetical protein QA641_12590 [Bradyrhizobium sp. CB1650]|uniref:hypothetical protein n=1 Tax=Bradyrhizobium sp. CB1650 TaxID=3039153 RepID=UPI002435D63B|nr:hypothetical protein [Bradyrhizobium sp. CB1650]WGD54666.1 hypothetical protein QA641_12590 [Bradyrhizobium sp. CB1650]